MVESTPQQQASPFTATSSGLLFARSLSDMNAYQSTDLVQALSQAISQGLIPKDTLTQALSQVGYTLPRSLVPLTDEQAEDEIYDFENPTAVRKRFSDF